MGKFNIYTRTSASHTLPQNITGMYIIEHIHDGKTDTYPPPTRSTLEHQDKASPWVMTAVLITRAVNVILCIKPQNIESITVYMDEISQRPFECNWPQKWEHDNYISTSGQAVPKENTDAWKRYNEYIHKLDGIKIEFAVTNGIHSYSKFMEYEIRKEHEKYKGKIVKK